VRHIPEEQIPHLQRGGSLQESKFIEAQSTSSTDNAFENKTHTNIKRYLNFLIVTQIPYLKEGSI
jgi:hypothetical protein